MPRTPAHKSEASFDAKAVLGDEVTKTYRVRSLLLARDGEDRCTKRLQIVAIAGADPPKCFPNRPPLIAERCVPRFEQCAKLLTHLIVRLDSFATLARVDEVEPNQGLADESGPGFKTAKDG